MVRVLLTARILSRNRVGQVDRDAQGRLIAPMADFVSGNQARTLDEREVAQFAERARAWWDPEGIFRPLHKLGPARLAFIRDQLKEHFSLGSGLTPLAGLRVLDIGCGGGLIAEPLARLGAQVSAIDPSPETIAVAEEHARGQGLKIDYRAARVEDIAAEQTTFDAVLCLEVIEHVPDPGAFLKACAALVRPGGMLILSTINRTMKAFALAIVGAEYVLRWLPVGTHQWERFITPGELKDHAAAASLEVRSTQGLVYRPLRDEWMLGADTDVNYLAAIVRPVGTG